MHHNSSIVVEYFSMRKISGKIIVPPGAFIDVHEKIAADYLALNLL